jgi:hypothetical protein
MQNSNTQTAAVTEHLSLDNTKAENIFAQMQNGRHQVYKATGKFPPLRFAPCICLHPTKAGYCVVTLAVAKAENLMVVTR